jgi:hypothetical protein
VCVRLCTLPPTHLPIVQGLVLCTGFSFGQAEMCHVHVPNRPLWRSKQKAGPQCPACPSSNVPRGGVPSGLVLVVRRCKRRGAKRLPKIHQNIKRTNIPPCDWQVFQKRVPSPGDREKFTFPKRPYWTRCRGQLEKFQYNLVLW